MSRTPAVVALSLVFAIPCRAETLPSFEAAVNHVRAAAVATRREQKEAQAQAAGQSALGKASSQEATVTGGMNHGPVDLTFYLARGFVTGYINHSGVRLNTDRQDRRISGEANSSPVDLRFEWTPAHYLVEGSANHSPVRLEIIWDEGTLRGYANHSGADLRFDPGTGRITGAANHSEVDVTFDRRTGRITGGMNHSPVNVTTANLGFYNFLYYFFLFLDTPGDRKP